MRNRGEKRDATINTGEAMIKKNENTLTVEGPVVEGTSPRDERLRVKRISIDVERGVILGVGEPEGDADLSVGDDSVILPGLIDAHVHAREDPSGEENYKETFRSAGEAAVHGGVTALVEMPNNRCAPIDDASYANKRKLTSSSPVPILLFAGIGPGTRPLSFPVPYKVYMGPSVGDLFFESDDDMREALAHYRGQRVAFHAEAPEILEEFRDAPSHPQQRPPHAEIVAIERVIESCTQFQIEPHICHLSTAGGLEVIRAARERGVRVSCEVTPHHLYYDQDNISSFQKPSYLQCNPPIRSRLDRIALLEAFRSGEIDLFATDHAPHSREENEAGISGIPQLDTFGPFLFWLRSEGASWTTIRKACCDAPGQFLNRYLPLLHGRIEPGFVGSVSILRKQSRTIRKSELKTQAGWSPFEGVDLGGYVSHTIVRGKLYTNPIAS